MTVIVLALDALDAGLVDYFDLDSFRLASSGDLGTFAHTQDLPYTPEVWATVATGLHPEEHGITGGGTSEWDNPVLEGLSRISGRLDESTRGTLGKVVRSRTGERERIGRTDAESIFDAESAVVHNWPGVADGRPLQRAWDLMNAVAEGMSRSEFERELFGQCAQQFAWAREMLRHPVSIAGVHIHALDAAGHAYADDEDALRHAYARVGEFVEETVDALEDGDDLLLLSDHGMRTEFYPPDAGKNPATHSWRAYASATTDTRPESVFDVRDWVDAHVSDTRVERENDEGGETIDVPEDHLRELGYLD
ncbi:type I phosphodiesterase/nucleotide pyrophosphatase [Natrinema hispanicum]|uniref:Type I phosphodiesterase/nucleotide pyrophosphatase n=1 Tax=Natrinema hispanicum TaxID=392421 RepID=A0A482Y7A5_9EURY|nr:alkaline phosphatase family protein [Natrinema hispanicum]RZV11043.1 type I phosphodiesterase/nucleotide pyrophosphatase [Natrinema hispanicum]